MNYSYFPGCTLRTKGAQLDRAGRRAAEKLGFSLCEIPEWQCCGAVYPQANDEIATRLSSVRALMAARDAGQPLVYPLFCLPSRFEARERRYAAR